MSPTIQSFLAGGAVVVAGFTVLWLLSIWRRDVSIIDVFWSLGFVATAVVYRGFGPPADWRHVLVLALVTIWGVRLALHLFLRMRGHDEDYRYQAMRRQAGESFWWKSYLRVFLLQAILLWIISAPLHAVQSSSVPGFRWTDAVGLLLWSLGFFFEAVGDYQLARFKSRPENRGQVMRTGLWAHTRHPNYFGDATLWWGYFFFALASPMGLWTLPSVLLMNFFLLRVSGVALLEKTITNRRPGYEEYIETVPAFVPWGLLGWRRRRA